MSRVRRYVRIPIALLLRRVRLPLIGRSVPVWALVAVVTPVVLFGGGSAEAKGK